MDNSVEEVISLSPGGGRPCGQGDQKGKDHAGNQRRIEKERPEGDWSLSQGVVVRKPKEQGSPWSGAER